MVRDRVRSPRMTNDGRLPLQDNTDHVLPITRVLFWNEIAFIPVVCSAHINTGCKGNKQLKVVERNLVNVPKGVTRFHRMASLTMAFV